MTTTTTATHGGQADLGPGPLTTVRRHADRARYDRASVHAVLDEALVCHLGFCDGDVPVVLPTIHARVGETLYLHGAAGNHALRSIDGRQVCVTATLVDSVVLARSALHHSLGYRSVVVYGRAAVVDDPEEKLRALLAVVDHVVPGRSVDARPPSAGELRTTRVVRVPIEEASAKFRGDAVTDEPEDLALAVWAGALPLPVVPGAPVPDGQGVAGLPVPAYLAPWRRPGAAAV